MTQPDHSSGAGAVGPLPGHEWAPPGQPPWPGPVPGVVRAAVIVTWFSCALAALAAIGLTVMSALIGSIVLPDFEPTARVQMVVFVLASLAVSLLACALASTCAWFVWRRRPWARVALAGCSALTLLSAAVFVSPPSLLVLPGTASVLVLLFLPQSNAWFRSRPTG